VRSQRGESSLAGAVPINQIALYRIVVAGDARRVGDRQTFGIFGSRGVAIATWVWSALGPGTGGSVSHTPTGGCRVPRQS